MFQYIFYTHVDNQFHHPQVINLASATHREWTLNRDKNQKKGDQKVEKKILQRQKNQ